MILCETATDELAKEVIAKMHEHVRNISGPMQHSILAEEGGRMVILITDWTSREQCLTYHASREYRRFVADTQHMLVGDYIVKLFHNRTNVS
jgi:quinol monooxygenase YgiN